MSVGGVFLATLNTNWNTQPPVVGPSGGLQVFVDGWWGLLQWSHMPQLYQEATEHWVLVYQVDKLDMVDPAFMTPHDSKEFKPFNYVSQKGCLRPNFLDTLLSL